MGAGDVGQHCGLKRLIAYRQGTLPAAEREAVQEHLSLCPRCTRLLLELRDFEAAAAGGDAGPESLRRAAWDSLARRLPAEGSPVPPAVDAIRNEAWWRSPRFAAIAVIAAAVLLLAVGLALWAAVTIAQERQRLTRLEQRLEEREAAIAALRSSLAQAERQLDGARGRIQDLEKARGERHDELAVRVAELTSELEKLRGTQAQGRREPIAVAASGVEVAVAPRFALRGQEPADSGFLRGGGAVNPVRIPSQEERFAVALSLPDRPVYGEYRLELVDREGKVLWAGRRPVGSLLGDAGTSVSVGGLGPGLYRLRIEGLRTGCGEPLAEYLLEVTASRR